MTQPAPTDPQTPPPAPAPPAPAPTPGGPAPQPPAPTPQPSAPIPGSLPTVPQFVAPPPAPQAPAQPATGDADSFPANTPVAQMTPDQQVAYWKHQSRKHEERVKSMADYDQMKSAYDEYQRLLTASQTEQEKAVAEARRQGHAEAMAAAGGQLVEQWVRAAAAGRLAEPSVDALLAGLDRTRFLRTDGGVDTDKVYQFVGSIVPAPVAVPAVTADPNQPGAVVVQPGIVPPPPPPVVTPAGGPDFGQGHPATARPSGIAAGREMARQRFGLNQSNSTTPA